MICNRGMWHHSSTKTKHEICAASSCQEISNYFLVGVSGDNGATAG